MKVPLSKIFIDESEINAAKEALFSGWLAHGPKNHELEESLKSLLGVKYAVSLNSCTSALFLAIKALGLKGEIILPSFTFVASANSIVTAGCTPRFADIEYTSCNIDPLCVEKLINKKTVGIMPVHFAGQCCVMNPLLKLAKKHDLALIEDSAETLGGTFNGRQAGSYGIGCFSFFPTKNITTGEGGALSTNDKKIYSAVRALAAHGIESTTFSRQKSKLFWRRNAIYAGYNFRMSNLLAAIGVEQMKKLEVMNSLRREKAALYLKLLDPDLFDLPTEENGCRHVYQMYTVKLKKTARLPFLNRLRSQDIGASVHFDPPVHLQSFYRNHFPSREKLPVTEKLAKSIITLPLYPGMSDENIRFVSQACNESARCLAKKFSF